MPVMLPPGLARLATNPAPTGFDDIRHDDRYCLRRPLKRARGRRVADQDDVDILPDQFAGQGVEAVHIVIGVDEFDTRYSSLPCQPRSCIPCLNAAQQMSGRWPAIRTRATRHDGWSRSAVRG